MQCPLGPQTCLRPTLCVFLLLSKRTLHDIIQCLFHNGIFNVWSLLVSFVCFLLIYFFIDFQTQKSLKAIESQSETAFAQEWLNRHPKLSSLKKYLSYTGRRQEMSSQLQVVRLTMECTMAVHKPCTQFPLLQPCWRIVCLLKIDMATTFALAKEVWVEMACVTSWYRNLTL